MRWLQLLLAGLTLAVSAGCATINDPGQLSAQTEATAPTAAIPDAVAQQAALPANAVTMYDVEPMEENVVAGILAGFRSDAWQPYLQSRAPPLLAAAPPTNQGPFSVSCIPGPWPPRTISFTRAPRPPSGSFCNELQTTLVPQRAVGSATFTYARASTAHQQDFEAKHNLVLANEARMMGARRVYNPISQAFTNGGIWNTSGASVTVTSGVADPLGGTSAFTITNVTAGNAYFYNNLTAGNPQSSYRNSIWIRKRVLTGTLAIETPSGVGETDITASVSTSWQRITTPVGVGGAATAKFLIHFDTLSDAIDVWHASQDNVSGAANQNPSEWIDPAVSHGAGANGVKYFDTLNGNTVASNVVTEATGAKIVAGASGVSAYAPVDSGGPFGYWAEGARADVLGTTDAIRRTMTDVGWVNGGTVTVGAATGIDGVASAGARLTFGAVQATNTILFTTVLGAAVRTYSAWVKRITGTGAVEMTKDGGVSWTDITSQLNTSTHSLVQVTTASAANPIVGFRGAVDTDVIDVDFNTVDPSTFANPTPIPVNVSKAGDVLTYVISGNAVATSGTASGTFTVGFSAAAAADTVVLSIADGSGLVAYQMNTAGPTQINAYDGTNGPNVSSTTAFNSPKKFATSWGPAGFTIMETAGGNTTAFSGNMGAGGSTLIGIGVNPATSAGQLNGSIRKIQIFPVQLPIGNLKTMVGDAIDWLNPDNWAIAANDDQYRKAANAR